jgi:hypothetical protein
MIMIAIVRLFEGTGGGRRRKENDRVNNIEMRCIYIGRWRNEAC